MSKRSAFFGFRASALGLVAIGATLAPGAVARAADPASPDLAAAIDAQLRADWQSRGIEPAPLADDATFLRRAYLDLCGTIPTVSEVRGYLADPAPDKRRQLIERLVNSPRFVSHLAASWRRILVPDEENLMQRESLAGFERWLREYFADGRGFDYLVADLLVASGSPGSQPATLFYTSRQLAPSDLAAATARLFLGVQVDCAECHAHPTEAWTQRDFWGLAAFFAQVGRGDQAMPADRVFDRPSGEVQLPASNETVAPAFLGSAQPAPRQVNRRQQLAIWLVARDNPYFAQTAVNRVWSELFGRGLIHPVDGAGGQHPASHPEVLELLRQELVANRFDLRPIYRQLAQTEAYALSSDVDPPPPVDSFAAMAVKPLTGEQIFSALERLALRPEPTVDRRFDPREAERQEFLERFRNLVDSDGTWRAGVPQVLVLVNGSLVAELVDPRRSRLLQALEAPWWTDGDRWEVLSLAALGHPPAQSWQQALRPLTGTDNDAPAQTEWSDLLWTLINSGEFLFNF